MLSLFSSSTVVQLELFSVQLDSDVKSMSEAMSEFHKRQDGTKSMQNAMLKLR